MGVCIPMKKPNDCKYCKMYNEWYDEESEIEFRCMIKDDQADNCPLIEIDLVRCGECKYGGESLLYPTEMVCKYHIGHTYYTEDDRFCYFGERREDE